jgi:hypothetical protein
VPQGKPDATALRVKGVELLTPYMDALVAAVIEMSPELDERQRRILSLAVDYFDEADRIEDSK